MGRGSIVAGGADGRYSVTLLRDQTRAQASKAELQAAKLEADQLIVDRTQALTDADVALRAAADALDAAIDAYIPGETSIEPVTAAQAEALRKQFERAEARTDLDLAYIERASIVQAVNAIDAIPADPTVDAWCADLTEDIAPGTEVGVIEPNDETTTQSPIIRPAFDPGSGSRAAYDPARDGEFQPVASTTPAGFYYNTALLPGAQKWRPQYRIGTVTAVDNAANTVDVALDAATATGVLPILDQNLDINQTATLEGVPVEYQDCDSQAFEVGDRVVIEFARDWDVRKCIGFESNPKPCALPGIFATVNDPLGQSPHGAVRFRYDVDAWELADRAAACENVRWVSASGAVVSWRGNRIGDAGYIKPGGTGESPVRFGPSIWYKGAAITAPGSVLGAALRTVEGEALLLAVVKGTGADLLYSYALTAQQWTLRGTWTHPADMAEHDVGVRFNQSGTEYAYIGVIRDSAESWTYRVYKVNWSELTAPAVQIHDSASTHTNTRGGSVTVTVAPDPIPNRPDNTSYTSNATSSHSDSWDYPVAVNYQGDTLIVARLVGSASSSMSGDFFRTVSESEGGFGRDTYDANGNASGSYTLEIKLRWNTPSGFEEITLENHTEVRSASFVAAHEELEVPGTGGLKRIYNYAPENGTQTTYKHHTDIVWLDLRANLAVVFEQIIDETVTTSGSRWINYDPWMVTGAPRQITSTIAGDATTECKLYPADVVVGTWTNDRSSVSSFWAASGFFGLTADEFTDALEMVEEASAMSPGFFGVQGGDGTVNFSAPPTAPQIYRKRDSGAVWPMVERSGSPDVAADAANRVLLSVNLQVWISEPYFPTVTPFNYLTDGDPVALVGGSGETMFAVRGFGV